MQEMRSSGTLRKRELGVGQVAMELDESAVAAADQVRDLIKISDLALSEREFDRLLDELLVRLRDLLEVDTVAPARHRVQPARRSRGTGHRGGGRAGRADP